MITQALDHTYPKLSVAKATLVNQTIIRHWEMVHLISSLKTVNCLKSLLMGKLVNHIQKCTQNIAGMLRTVELWEKRLSTSVF